MKGLRWLQKHSRVIWDFIQDGRSSSGKWIGKGLMCFRFFSKGREENLGFCHPSPSVWSHSEQACSKTLIYLDFEKTIECVIFRMYCVIIVFTETQWDPQGQLNWRVVSWFNPIQAWKHLCIWDLSISIIYWLTSDRVDSQDWWRLCVLGEWKDGRDFFVFSPWSQNHWQRWSSLHWAGCRHKWTVRLSVPWRNNKWSLNTNQLGYTTKPWSNVCGNFEESGMCTFMWTLLLNTIITWFVLCNCVFIVKALYGISKAKHVHRTRRINMDHICVSSSAIVRHAHVVWTSAGALFAMQLRGSPGWNVSTSIRWISMKFSTDIHWANMATLNSTN